MMAADLQAVLDAREARWLRKLELCRRGPLLTLTMNVPGPEKNPSRWNDAHRRLTAMLKKKLEDHLLVFEESGTPAGAEAHFVTDFSAIGLKKQAVELEEAHPIGRLLDADVMDRNGEPVGRDVLGLPARLCLCCGGEAKTCARVGRHSLAELLSRADALFDLWETLNVTEGRGEC